MNTLAHRADKRLSWFGHKNALLGNTGAAACRGEGETKLDGMDLANNTPYCTISLQELPL